MLLVAGDGAVRWRRKSPVAGRGFNKHRRPTKSVGYFDQRRRLLSALIEVIKERSLRPLINTVAYSSQTGCLLQTLLKPLYIIERDFLMESPAVWDLRTSLFVS